MKGTGKKLLQQNTTEVEANLLSKKEKEKYLKELKSWVIDDEDHLVMVIEFNNFEEAINFINEVAAISEVENHHPDILLFNLRRVCLRTKTFSINELTLRDFILASKIDNILIE